MAIYDFFLSRNGAPVTAETYVGHVGRLFYDDANGVVKLSDGVTAGGQPIPYTIATDTIVGGIKEGPGVTINSEGQILIDSSGLSFSFGDFSATVPNIGGIDVAVLSSINLNEDIVIETNGTGAVEIVGIFNVHATNGTLAGSLAAEPIFRVNTDGKVRILAPNTDGIAGAVEVTGYSTGEFHPPNQTGVIIHSTGVDGLISRQYIDANNNYPVFVGRRYNGAVNALTPVLNGETIFRIAGQGSTGTNFETFGVAGISWFATEDQSTSNQGGKIVINVTGNGNVASAATAINVAEFTENGIIAELGVTGDLTGNASTVTNGVYTTGDQTIAGNKTFSGNTDLGANTNVKISGGLVGELLTSDGAGNLTWSLAPAATYYESSTQTPETFTPAPLTAISGLSLTAIAGTYRIESSIQYTVIPAKVSTELATDLTTLIATIDAQTSPIAHAAGYGGGEIITAGYYFVAGATTHTGNIIFDADGDPDATFIFKCGAAHALAVGATTSLINGAKASNIFWYVIGALSMGASCDIQGTYIGSGAVAPGTPFSLEGRILTKTGAITMAEATFAVPVGIPSLNMGLLEEFAFFTPAGAISNTIIPGGIGDVSSGAGIISGFSEIEGIVYLADDTISEVEFELYQNNNRIASSLFSSKTQIFSRSQHATILGTATGGAGENIELRGRALVGTLISNNRSIFALKLD
jgi:hypothetical protein